MRTYLRWACLMAAMAILAALCAGLGLVWAGPYVWPAQTPKTLMFLTGATAMAGFGWAYCLTLEARPALRLSRVDVTLGAVLVFIVANRYLLQDVRGFSPRFYELGGLAVVYVLARASGSRLQRVALTAVVAGGGIQAAYGALQLYGVYPSLHPRFAVTGGFFNPGPYAGYLAITFGVAGGVYLSATPTGSDRDKLDKISLRGLGAAVMVAIALMLPITGSRSGLVGLMAGGGYLLATRYDLRALGRRHLPTRGRKILAGALLALLLAGGALGAYLAKKGSADGRVLIWKVTAGMIGGWPGGQYPIYL